jgi:hypothetical protein
VYASAARVCVRTDHVARRSCARCQCADRCALSGKKNAHVKNIDGIEVFKRNTKFAAVWHACKKIDARCNDFVVGIGITVLL